MIRQATRTRGDQFWLALGFCVIRDVVVMIYMREYELLWVNLTALIFIC